jgi:hypothetical protein
MVIWVPDHLSPDEAAAYAREEVEERMREEEAEDPRGGHGCGRCGKGIWDDRDLCDACEDLTDMGLIH